MTSCESCHKEVNVAGAKLCDRCWELRKRVETDPLLALQFLLDTPACKRTSLFSKAIDDLTVMKSEVEHAQQRADAAHALLDDLQKVAEEGMGAIPAQVSGNLDRRERLRETIQLRLSACYGKLMQSLAELEIRRDQLRDARAERDSAHNKLIIANEKANAYKKQAELIQAEQADNQHLRDRLRDAEAQIKALEVRPVTDLELHNHNLEQTRNRALERCDRLQHELEAEREAVKNLLETRRLLEDKVEALTALGEEQRRLLNAPVVRRAWTRDERERQWRDPDSVYQRTCNFIGRLVPGITIGECIERADELMSLAWR